MRSSILVPVTVLLSVVASAACAQKPGDAPATSSRIAISGSKTLQPVVQQWVDEFRRSSPGVEIVVEGGGTDKGFEDLFAGKSQVAMAARQITEREREAATAKGLKLEELVVARAGISVLKNKANPIGELDLAVLRRIFDGSVTNWRDLGGPDQAITVILRNPESHTAEFFRTAVVGLPELTSRGIVVGTQEEVVKEITAKPWAIGFADFDRALSHLDEVEVLKVRTGEGQAKLVFVRSLYFYMRAPVSGALRALCDFTKSQRGGEIAVLHSYFGPNDPY